MTVDYWPEAASPLERLIENIFLQAELFGHNVALYDEFCSCQWGSPDQPPIRRDPYKLQAQGQSLKLFNVKTYQHIISYSFINHILPQPNQQHKTKQLGWCGIIISKNTTTITTTDVRKQPKAPKGKKSHHHNWVPFHFRRFQAT